MQQNPAYVAFGLAANAVTNSSAIIGNSLKAAQAFDSFTRDRDFTHDKTFA